MSKFEKYLKAAREVFESDGNKDPFEDLQKVLDNSFDDIDMDDFSSNEFLNALSFYGFELNDDNTEATRVSCGRKFDIDKMEDIINKSEDWKNMNSKELANAEIK